ncbi:MAG: FkbM family methyltransferase [Planctomycetota bacterium]
MSLNLKPLRSLLRAAVHACGWELYRRPVQMNGLWAHLQSLFQQQQIDCVLDVGGHHGEYASELRSYGYKGRIISFEPCPESFRVLSANCAADPLWSCHGVALGARDGELPFHVMSDTRFSSFLQPTESALEWSENGCHIERTEIVPVRRLDQILADAGLPASTRYYLKIDTQGAERDVIAGATSALNSIVALQAEVPVRPLYQGVTTYADFIAEMGYCGYDLTGLYPAAQEDDLRVIEFDCVMLRHEKAPTGSVLAETIKRWPTPLIRSQSESAGS